MRNDKYKRKEDDWNFFCDFPPIDVFLKAFPHKGHPHGKSMFFRTKFKHPLTYVERGDNEYIITMEIPGISKDQINLEVTSDELWFKAVNEELEKEYQYHLYLRKPIKAEEISARLKAGILTIKAPYSEPNSKRKVNID
ncbi:MAG: Hsp20/alpha crystallin family protein [Candidatus Hodarchaeota archaeon]